MRKNIVITTILIIGVLLTASSAMLYADHGGKSCATCEKAGDSGGWGLEEKFFSKTYFILDNAEQLGLSDAQKNDIETLKMNVKKTIIRQEADIDIASLDIKTKMHDYPVDGKVLEALVAQKADLEKAKDIQITQAYTQLKNGLTQPQYDKMKEIWQQKK